MKDTSDTRISEARWQVWYQDMFDRECPRQVDASGVGLLEGLTKLWSRYLRETIQANGQEGFSRFNLWWDQESCSISIRGNLSGALRLKDWIVDRSELLQEIACIHCKLLLHGENSEIILESADTVTGYEDFKRKLSGLSFLAKRSSLPQ